MLKPLNGAFLYLVGLQVMDGDGFEPLLHSLSDRSLPYRAIHTPVKLSPPSLSTRTIHKAALFTAVTPTVL